MRNSGEPKTATDLFTSVGAGWLPFVMPYAAAVLSFLIFPEYNALATALVIMIVFALSVEVVLGFGGINTLGQSVMFGTGAYLAGFAALYGDWHDPFAMLLVGAVGGAAAGLVTGRVVLRGSELTVLAMTIVTAGIGYELTNTFSRWTGGFDGLRGVVVNPIFGIFAFDLWGNTGFWLSISVLLVAHVSVLLFALSPIGVTARGIKSNSKRMEAIGVPVRRRLLLIYAFGGSIAGLAGALQTVNTSSVTSEAMSFYASATVVVVMVLGGFGRIYGAFLGSAVYVLLQDYLAKIAPEYWLFWLGIILVTVVWLAPHGIMGALRRGKAWREVK